MNATLCFLQTNSTNAQPYHHTTQPHTLRNEAHKRGSKGPDKGSKGEYARAGNVESKNKVQTCISSGSSPLRLGSSIIPSSTSFRLRVTVPSYQSQPAVQHPHNSARQPYRHTYGDAKYPRVCHREDGNGNECG